MDLCNPDTVPKDLRKVVSNFSSSGKRVLAMAYKKEKSLHFLEAQRMSRHVAESDLTFLGLLLLQNKLKPDTSDIIHGLAQESQVRCVMATGDNALTAISVARDCGICPHTSVIFGDIPQKRDRPHEKASGAGVVWTEVPLGGSAVSSTRIESRKLSEVLSKSSLDPKTAPLVLTGSAFRHLRLQFEANKDLESESTRQDSRDHFPSTSTASRGFNNTSRGYNDEDERIQLFSNNPEKNKQIQNKFCEATSTIEDQQNNLKLDIVSNKRTTIFEYVCRRGCVFARMSPDDKAHLVESIQALEEKPFVGMCGDGANDCHALRVADVGVSLSDREASVVAPFTAMGKCKSIAAVDSVLREGRASLVNSYGAFKFIAVNAMIQFSAVMFCFSGRSNMTDFQGVFIDVCTVLPVCWLMARTTAAKQLSPLLPGHSLVSLPMVVSMFGNVMICVFFQMIMFIYVLESSWQVPPGAKWTPGEPDDHMNLVCPLNTSLFMLCVFQNTWVAISFAQTRPWRKSLWTNYLFVIYLVALVLLGAYMHFFSGNLKGWEQIDHINPKTGQPDPNPTPTNPHWNWLNKAMNLTDVPLVWRFINFGMVFLNLFLLIAFEWWGIHYWERRVARKKLEAKNSF